MTSSQEATNHPEKPRIATVSLAGCFGCHMSILDIDERILALAEIVDFARSPINDYKTFDGRCTVGIIEGGCCNEENVHVLEDFRKNCDVLVSLGDCAINGGIPAMRNNIPLRECLEEAYLKSPGVYNPSGTIPNDEELPLLLNRVYPCNEVVKIDHFIPGCPPPADAIFEVLSALLAGRTPAIAYGDLKYD
ncbi:MAG: NADP oxidoreductase [Deltaproteobacteria bacterium]|nr:NADP oxidoreductase [Deltaproteobacteria bacterium]